MRTGRRHLTAVVGALMLVASGCQDGIVVGVDNRCARAVTVELAEDAGDVGDDAARRRLDAGEAAAVLTMAEGTRTVVVVVDDADPVTVALDDLATGSTIDLDAEVVVVLDGEWCR